VLVSLLATFAYYLLLLYFFVMWARFILDLARTFARDWRPRGFSLILAEIVYSLTDPPIRGVRRIMPPIRIGPAALDFGWSIVMLVVVVLIYVTLVLRNAA
jgi:YggT family protein